MEALTCYMAVELAARRVAVNVVAPGAIVTDFSGGIVRDNPLVSKGRRGSMELCRAGVPGDVGLAIAAVLSNEFGWVNAQRIEVAGGVYR